MFNRGPKLAHPFEYPLSFASLNVSGCAFYRPTFPSVTLRQLSAVPPGLSIATMGTAVPRAMFLRSFQPSNSDDIHSFCVHLIPRFNLIDVTSQPRIVYTFMVLPPKTKAFGPMRPNSFLAIN